MNLKLAIKASIPIISATTTDTINLKENLLEIFDVKKVRRYKNGEKVSDDSCYYYWDRKLPLATPEAVYEEFANANSCLLVINPIEPCEVFYNVGGLPTPRESIYEFLSDNGISQKRSEELIPALGGLTIKEVTEVMMMTQARDGSLTPEGVIKTRQLYVESSQGLDIVDTDIRGYNPYTELQSIASYYKRFFLGDYDARLRPRGLLAHGVPGCVAEGTLIKVKRGARKAGRFLPIEDLYAKYNNIGNPKKPWRKALTSYTQSWRAETGEIIYNKIEGVYDKGYKTCIKVSVEGGGSIVLTCDHPILQGDGVFVEAGSLKIGDRVLIKSSMLPQGGGRQVRKPRIIIEGLKYYLGGWKKEVKDSLSGKTYRYQRQHKARLVVEAWINNIDYDEFIHILKTDKEKSKSFLLLSRGVDVHHIDENPMNDVLTNLQVLRRTDHYLLHNSVPQKNFKVEYTKQAKVTGIEKVGLKRTFDLSMGEPAANFVVNDGIIVHNTGKTLGAKYLAREWGVPLYRLDASIQSKWVGQSENNMINALRHIENEAPAILLIDEVEKFFSGENDTGVTQKLLGSLLWWMQEHRSKVFTYMTCNSKENIPPELYRPGRITKELEFKPITGRKAIIKAIEVISSSYAPHTVVIKDIKTPDEVTYSELNDIVLHAIREHIIIEGKD